MCGIVYTLRLDGKNASKMVMKRYNRQKHRGSQGFGFISLSGGMMNNYNRATSEKGITELINSDDSQEIIFHHRFPTSTPNFKETAHPIKVSHNSLKYDYYVIHNGVISNDDELKAKHEKEGFKYSTEVFKKWRSGGHTISSYSEYNDTECLAIELAKDLDGKKAGIEHVKGSVAFIALQVVKNSKKAVRLYFGRNTMNPLKLKLVDGTYMTLTSEGEGEPITPNTLHTVEYKDVRENKVTLKSITKTPYQIGTKIVEYPSKYYGNSTYHYPSNTAGYKPTTQPIGFKTSAVQQMSSAEFDAMCEEEGFMTLPYPKQRTDASGTTEGELDEGVWYEGITCDILDDDMLFDACLERNTLREDLKAMAQGEKGVLLDDWIEDRITEINEAINEYTNKKDRIY